MLEIEGGHNGLSPCVKDVMGIGKQVEDLHLPSTGLQEHERDRVRPDVYEFLMCLLIDSDRLRGSIRKPIQQF